MEIVPGPDFPTGGIICGRGGIRAGLRDRPRLDPDARPHRRRGAPQDRAQVDRRHRDPLPGQQGQADREDRRAGPREEASRASPTSATSPTATACASSSSSRRTPSPEVVLNNLYKMTPLQESFGVNMLAIVDGRPQCCRCKEALLHFIDHRREVVTRRTLFELREAERPEHIVEGLGIAVDNIDRGHRPHPRRPRTPTTAKARPDGRAARRLEFLRAPAARGEIAAHHAARLTSGRPGYPRDALQRLTGLEREKLERGTRAVRPSTAWRRSWADETVLMQVIIDELEEVRDAVRRRAPHRDRRRRGRDRRRGLIADEEMVVTVTHGGYVKRSADDRCTGRRSAAAAASPAPRPTRRTSSPQLFVASTHDTLLMFTNKGRVYAKKVYEVPAGRRAPPRARRFVNLLELQEGERVVALLPVREFSEGGVRGDGHPARA